MKHFIFLITFLLSTTLCYSQLEIGSFEFEGLTREYEIFLPQNYQPNMPLVFVFHGYTEGLGFIREYTQMNEVADTAGFVVVYPQSIWPSWNCGVIAIPPFSPIDTSVHDVAFISALMDSLFIQYDIDINRVYSCGFSMGGEMTYRLNAEIGHRFAAFASVAGLLNDVSAAAYIPRTPKPILHFHGTLDNYEYYDGGWSNLWSVDATLSFWLEKNDCQLTPDTIAIPNIDLDECTAEMISYTDCWGTSRIIFYKITGGGHSWPGTPYNYGWAGNVNRDIHASSLIWDFFKDYILVSQIVENPFGLPIIEYPQTPRFVDLDGDGDQDYLMSEDFGGGKFHYCENIGTPSVPQFAPSQDNPFGLESTDLSTFPTIEDLDGDGDFDLLVGTFSGLLKYYENIGSATEPQFASPTDNPFGFTSTNIIAMPTLIDLDDDGDFDLMVGEIGGVMQYFENTGSATEPFYASPQADPFGLESTTGTGGANTSSFADLDLDGDMDMLTGRAVGTEYFENIGSASDPQFALPILDPFGIDPMIEWVFPEYVDLDNDGDMDLLLAHYSDSGRTQYYENRSPVSVIDNPQSLAIGLYPNPVMDILYFEAEEQIDRIEIFSITGQLTRVFENPGNHILLGDLNPGLYVIRILSVNGNFAVRKLQKL